MCFFYVPYQHHKCQIVAGLYIQLGIIVLFLSALPLLILNMDWKTGWAIYHQQLFNQLKQQTYNLNISVCFSLSVEQCQHFL